LRKKNVGDESGKDDEVILVFLFIAGIAIKTGTHHLKLCHSFSNWMDEDQILNITNRIRITKK
jgi:hypothetical protein